MTNLLLTGTVFTQRLHSFIISMCGTTEDLLMLNALQYLHIPTIAPIVWLTLNVE